MEFEVGAIVTGKITGITKFGAFVTIAPGKSGLVHISEITSAYVSDIRDHLTEGQEVTVKILGIDESGRMNLSMKAVASTPASVPYPASQLKSAAPGAEPTFEDKLKRFMQDSDSRMSGLKRYPDKKNARRRSR